MTKRYFLALSGTITVFILLGILGNKYYPDLNHWLHRNGSARSVVLIADPVCNPVGKLCTASDGTLAVTIGLGDSVKPLIAFPVQVKLSGEEAAKIKKITVNFTMLNMDMGFNQFTLAQGKDKTWQGQAILPMCSMGHREWRVTVEIVSDTLYRAEFNLLTDS
ncbi:MAG: hypothetical protein RKO66_15810 [Candidatus Contendobacter sp.]|nr:hypothetical protein [Candidatus Contendobacter sp.]